MKRTPIRTGIAGLVLLAALVFSCCTVALAAPTSGQCGSNLSWRSSDGTLTISGSGAMTEFFQKSGAPWKHLAKQTKKVVIGDSVTSLSYEAFRGFDKLETVRIGSGVKEIHSYVFSHLPRLQQVVLGEKVEKIGAMAFDGCTALTEVRWGGGVEQLGRMAFHGCTSLERVELPESVRHIGSDAFAECTALAEIHLPKNLLDIGVNALRGTAWEAQQAEGAQYLDRVFLGWKGEVPARLHLQVKSGTRLIGDGAMVMEDRLEQVTLPESLRRIGQSAFDGCRNLTAVELAEGVTTIGVSAFGGCTALEYIALPDSVTAMDAAVFSGSGLTNLRLSSHLGAIPPKAFSRCDELRRVSVPSSVRRIYEEAFYQCGALGEVTFYGSAPQFARDSFSGVEARAYCPAGWSSSARADYGGELQWISVDNTLDKPELHLSIRAKDGKPRLQWSAASGADGYQVYCRTEEHGPLVRLTTAHGTTLRHSSAQPGVRYDYRVRVVKKGQVGPFSAAKYMTCDCAMPVVEIALQEAGQPVLTWQAVDGAVGYEVFCAAEGEDFIRLTTVHGTRLRHSSAQPGRSYAYQVRAICSNPNGNGARSAAVQIHCPGQLTAPVIRGDFDPDTGMPRLQWPEVREAERYEIWRSCGGAEAVCIAATEDLCFIDRQAPIGTECVYQVRAVNLLENGPLSEAAALTYTLRAPQVTVTLRTDGKPRLQWAPVGGAEGYQVLASEDGETFQPLLCVSGTGLNHVSAQPGSTWFYRVCAVAGELTGPESETVSAQCPPLTAPEVTSARRADTGKPVLTWTEVTGAERYEVWRSVEDGESTLFYTTRGTRMTNSSAQAGVKYTYRVRAVTQTQQGPFSQQRTRTCDCAAPKVTLSLSGGHPVLQWDWVDQAERYEVWVRENGGKERLLYTARGVRLTHSSARSGHRYSYRVKALCANHYADSGFSQRVEIEVP